MVWAACIISFELHMCFGLFGTWRRTTWTNSPTFIAIPHERDGLRPSLLHAGTSACTLKRSGLVTTALVLSFGLPMSFGAFCRMNAQWRDGRLYCNSSMDKMDCELCPCLRVRRHVYRRGLDWFQQPWSFRLSSSSVLVHFAHCGTAK